MSVKPHPRYKPEPASGPAKKAGGKGFGPGDLRGLKFSGSERNLKILGVLIGGLAFFMLLSMVSHLLYWRQDQSALAGHGLGKLFSADRPDVSNWLGFLGAWTAHFFMNRGFGISSFILVFSLLYAGFKWGVQIRIVPRFPWAHLLYWLIWPSLFFGFLMHFWDFLPDFMGGAYGFLLNQALFAFVGKTGMGLIIGMALVIYLVITVDLDLHPGRWNWVRTLFFTQASKANAPEVETQEEFPVAGSDGSPGQVSPVEKDMEVGAEEELEEPLKPELARDQEGPDEGDETPDTPMPELTVEAKDEDDDEEQSTEVQPDLEPYDPTAELSSYKFPELELLNEYGSGKIKMSQEELQANTNKIVQTLGQFDIAIDKIKATVGPTVTLYEIIPAPGVRISKIRNLEDDIALSIAALGIRIIAPIPGKGTIGIEVPNRKPETVGLRGCMQSPDFQDAGMELPLVLGRTISNDVFVADLAKMPHLLVAGATGQGKSVGINAILASLLYKKHPSQLKLVLVDPKKVELSLYQRLSRHFLAQMPGEDDPIITDTKKVVRTLNSLCIEMDERYDLLQEAHVRNLREYNRKFVSRKLNPEKGHRYLPYIVLVIDEFADLIMTAGKEIETPIARLAQLARAVGVHMVIATQRPSVNIITGTIKANFPARLAFRVTSKVDSRTILDSGGADQLIGKGDMLLSLGTEPVRLQCAFIDTPEVDKLVDFISGQRGYPLPFQLPEVQDEEESGAGEVDLGTRDALFDEAAGIVVQHQQGSTSLLQRRLKIGYNRAGRLIDQLEAAGIVGPFEGSKARDVLMPDAYALEQHLNQIKADNPDRG